MDSWQAGEGREALLTPLYKAKSSDADALAVAPVPLPTCQV